MSLPGAVGPGMPGGFARPWPAAVQPRPPQQGIAPAPPMGTPMQKRKLEESAAGSDMAMSGAKKARLAPAPMGQRKPGMREEEGPGGGDEDVDDMTDATKVAGVDIEKEVYPGYDDQEEMSESDFKDREEDLFIDFDTLKARVLPILTQAGIKSIFRPTMQLMSLALQQRLRQLMEDVVSSSHQRREKHRNLAGTPIPTKDPAAQMEVLGRVVKGAKPSEEASETKKQDEKEGNVTLRDMVHAVENDRELARGRLRILPRCYALLDQPDTS